MKLRLLLFGWQPQEPKAGHSNSRGKPGLVKESTDFSTFFPSLKHLPPRHFQ
jgi:hypothetical protein